MAQSLIQGGTDDAAVLRRFGGRRAGWFIRLPFGIGGATLRARLRLLVGLPSGVHSAGNGAAMRAAT
ncbi:MAG: hypothetical protein R3F43_11670 [bacterium]